MRRTLRFLLLAAAAAAAAGCGKDNRPNVNSPGTTVYGNENVPSGGGASAPATTGAPPSNANSNRPNEGGIKPPTSK